MFLKKKNIGKIISVIMLALFAAGFSSCIFADYKDTVTVVPGDAQVVFNISIESFFKRRAVLSEISELKDDPSAKKFLDNLEELAFTAAFSYAPADMDLEEDFFPHLNTNFSVAFYEVGSNFFSILSKLDNPLIPEEKFFLPFVCVFDVKDREGVEEFISKLNGNYGAKEEIYDGQAYFSSSKSAYFLNEDFFVIASSPDLLKSSIDCSLKRKDSLVENDNFSVFRKERFSEESVGFLYWNVPSLSKDFLADLPPEAKEPWKDLLDSIEYMGTDIELDRSKLKFMTYLVSKEELTPLGEEFFSIPSRDLQTLGLFPENSSCVLALGEPDRVLSMANNLFEAFLPEDVEKFKNFFTSGLGISLDSIFSSLAREVSLSFVPGEDDDEDTGGLDRIVSGTWAAGIEVRKESSLNNNLISAENILSIIGKVDTYEDMSITSFPDRSVSFTRLDEFLIIGFGNTEEHMKAIIDTFLENEDSVEERISPQISTEAVGVLYLNLYDLYSKNFQYLIRDEELKEKLSETFESYPEVWGSIKSEEDGYVSLLIMPF